MKKIIALVMVVAMIAAMCITTSAEDAAAPTDGLIAHFTFDDAESGLTGGGATAHPKKFDSDFVDDEAHIIEDADRGNVYDFGVRSDNRFLEVTKDDGSSLLAGVEELTISFWFNSTDGGTNWYFWSVGRNEDGKLKDPLNNIDSSYTSSENTDATDEYVGLLETGGSAKGEFYYNPVASRDVSNATGSFTVVSGEWNLFTMTIDSEGNMMVYQNGEWAAENLANGDRGYTIADILGEDPATFIGMALWGNPAEFSLGQIDDYYIYDTALKENSPELLALWAAQGLVVEPPADETEAPAESDTPSDETEAPSTNAPTTNAPTTNASTNATTTDAAKEEGGCGSTLGTAAAIITVASVFGCAVTKRKH